VAAVSTNEPIVVVTDPVALDALQVDLAGLAFETSTTDKATAASATVLASSFRYRDIVNTLRDDLKSIYSSDSRWGVGMKYVHRGFDPDWLTMPSARWQLSAVVNRIDRRAFHPGTCGVCRHRTCCVACRRHGDFFDTELFRHRYRSRHPAGLETLGGVLALVFDEEMQFDGKRLSQPVRL
jgi:hypothetical protein